LRSLLRPMKRRAPGPARRSRSRSGPPSVCRPFSPTARFCICSSSWLPAWAGCRSAFDKGVLVPLAPAGIRPRLLLGGLFPPPAHAQASVKAVKAATAARPCLWKRLTAWRQVCASSHNRVSRVVVRPVNSIDRAAIVIQGGLLVTAVTTAFRYSRRVECAVRRSHTPSAAGLRPAAYGIISAGDRHGPCRPV
jgi:hypothetical protein